MDVINELGGLINQDLTPAKHQPNILYDSVNFRVTTEYGATSLARTNVRGEVDLFNIPTIYNVWRLEFITNDVETITITYDTGTDVYTQLTTNLQDVVDFFNTSPTVIAGDYRIFLASDGKIYVYGVNVQISSITTTNAAVNATLIYSPTILPVVIGWTVMREDIYIFTTEEKTLVNTGFGQIWKFSYPKSGDYTDPLIYTFDLVWYGQGGFTQARPIANPGAIESRYENTNIQRIYWTDNYNVPRTINVGNPLAYTLLSTELDLFPSVTFDIPVFKQILQGGNLNIGMYQVAYRLKRRSGSQSQFSSPCGAVAVVKSNEISETFIRYTCDDSTVISDKSLVFEIENIDTSFEIIELAYIYYAVPGGIPLIKLFLEEPIASDKFEFTLTGNEETIELSIDEFTSFAPNITRAKALASKNNTLFLSNVELNKFDVDYDTRAYRFPINTNQTEITDGQGNSYTVEYDSGLNTFQIIAENFVPVTPYDIPEDHDCIQDYLSQAPNNGWTNNLYLPNTGLGSYNLLGGQGPNITWSFNRETITLDNKFIGSNPITYPAGTGSYSEAPHRTIFKKSIAYSGFTSHPFVARDFYDSFHSPYLNTRMKQYMRDEMYRFGVVFYDRKGNASYVKWIADIRMPHVYMPNGANSYNRELLYPISSYNSSNVTASGSLLGLRVQLRNLNTIPDAVAYEIVRVPREEDDRRILGQGRLMPVFKGDGSASDAFDHFLSNDADHLNMTDYTRIWSHMFTLRSPDFQFDEFANYETTDEVDIIGLLNDDQATWLKQGSALGYNEATEKGVIVKNYSYVDSANIPYSIKSSLTENPYPVRNAAYIEQASWASTESADNLKTLFPALTAISSSANVYRTDGDTPNAVRSTQIAGRCVGIVYGPQNSAVAGLPYGGSFNFLDSSFAGDDFVNLDTWGNSNASYLANYKRNVTDQYGGNTYSDRSNNIYINCNNRVLLPSGTTASTTDVFGGDTYVVAYDNVSEFPDWNQTNKYTRHFIFACESNINTELRGTGLTQNVPNKNNPTGNAFGSGDLDADETYEKFDNNLLSFDTYVKIFLPKPFNFVEETEFDTRSYKSNLKTNGEEVDSWSSFAPNAFLDVESKYGPINNLMVFQDKLYYFQDRGFGVFQVNAQKAVLDATDTSELIIGSSGILERFDYISTATGSKHQFSFNNTDHTMIWFDALSRKLYRFYPGKLEPISDIKGLSGFIYNRVDGIIQDRDNPYTGVGVHCTYDYRYNEYRIN